MRVVKPTWVEHTGGEKKTKGTVYSLSVHPDGTRLATGGVDRKIKIWSTVPILNSDAEKVEANEKLLCTMSEHTGAVLTVRWAHNGRYLASGSDDQVGMIWGLDPDGGGRLWGSDEVNVENWKPLKRLVAHVADIIDMAWSRDDSMLASVGLDSTVWIWDGQTFERVKKLDRHEGSVKGVCWDPVGNYLATQSDDKTVKIWNTDTWELVSSVSDPFANSGLSTFFRRLSWSPDGAFIAASNAKNGPVFVAAVIDRDSWATDISFVGHANTIQVAAFNPLLFFLAEDRPSRATAKCMLALGADDFSISIWQNSVHYPLVVLHNLFENALMDLCWSNDGHTLYGCSEDGTICAITFDDPEIPTLGTSDQTKNVLAEYQYQPLNRRASPAPVGVITNGFGAATSSSSVVNVIQARKVKPGDQRRRVNFSQTQPPSLLNHSSNASAAAGSSRAPFAPPRQSSPGPSTYRQSAFDGPIQDQFTSPSQAQATTASMFRDANTAFGNGGGRAGSPSKAGSKRKAGDLMDDRARKGRMMTSSGNGKASAEVVEIRPARTIQAGSGSTSGPKLPIPTIQSILRVKPSGGIGEQLDHYLEVENAKDKEGRNKVMLNYEDGVVWVDYLPSPVLALAVGVKGSVVGCEDGSVVVYSPAGRHLASMRLPSMPIDLSISTSTVAILTADAEVRVSDLKTSKLLIGPTSLFHLLNSSIPTKPFEIERFTAHTSGACSILTTEPAAYALDPTSQTWIPLITPFHLDNATIVGNQGPGGPLRDIEQEVRGMVRRKTVVRGEKPEWFDESSTLGHLEMMIKGSEVLGSAEEYQFWVIEYARYLGKEDFDGRLEESLKDLLGSAHSSPIVDKGGIVKRVLAVLGSFESMSSLVDKYETLLDLVKGIR